VDRSIEILKVIAEDTRFNIVKLLLQNDYCVSGLAIRLALSEPAISQHLKILKEAGLIFGEKRGYFMHYYVDKTQLEQLITQLDTLVTIQRKPCQPEEAQCHKIKKKRCLRKTKNIDQAYKCHEREVKEKDIKI